MSVSEWKAREKEQRRNDIIDAAEKLFFSKGFDEVSMDDIAKEIKLNKATLYRYFMSKEALFFTVVLRGVKIHNEMLTQGIKKAGNSVERLTAIGNVSYDFAREYPDYHRIVSYYSSGRFYLTKLEKSDDIALLPSSSAARNNPADRKWVKLAETTDSDVVKEISRLRWEMFDITRRSMQIGQEDGALVSSLSPEKLAVLYALISNALVSINPDYKCLLEHMGIDPAEFVSDSRAFIQQAITKD